MLTITVVSKKEIRLSGAIDGSEDLHAALGSLEPGTVLDCEGVHQINSTGIKSWMRYFCAPDKEPLQLKFVNFSVPLVEQLNMFRNFIGKGQVVSMALPFRCETCNLNFSKHFKVSEVEPFRNGQGTVPCPQCGGPAFFDDLADEYFEFLKRP